MICLSLRQKLIATSLIRKGHFTELDFALIFNIGDFKQITVLLTALEPNFQSVLVDFFLRLASIQDLLVVDAVYFVKVSLELLRSRHYLGQVSPEKILRSLHPTHLFL